VALTNVANAPQMSTVRICQAIRSISVFYCPDVAVVGAKPTPGTVLQFVCVPSMVDALKQDDFRSKEKSGDKDGFDPALACGATQEQEEEIDTYLSFVLCGPFDDVVTPSKDRMTNLERI
jgi:hypothetical protein